MTSLIVGGELDRATTALSAGRLEGPKGWAPVRIRRDLHDTYRVTIVRFQPDGYRLGGPQLSVVLDNDNTLLGYTRLTVPDSDRRGELPTTPIARQAAFDFIGRVDAGYAMGLREQWIDRHDEYITAADGTTHVVEGVKVKLRHSSGRYAWVVLGHGNRVITYEREITWDSEAGRRSTRMWLHDRWIAAHDEGGDQPEPPYAA